MEPKDRILDLRKALDLTQGELAKRTGGELDQSYIAKLERGVNRASTVKVRQALARGFGVSETTLQKFFDGVVTLEVVLEEIAKAKKPEAAAQAPVLAAEL